MDRRQLLERLGAFAVAGDLADDVVIVCSAETPPVEGGDAWASLVEAREVVRALAEYERPTVASPASLDCMSATGILSDAVGQIAARRRTPQLGGLADVGGDLDTVLHDWSDRDARARISAFFGSLASGMLQSSDVILKPHVREATWIPAASSF